MIEYEGNIYEKGKVYEFRDHSGDWVPDVLQSVGTRGTFVCTAGNYSAIREINAEIGTIKPAPVSLKEGSWYMMDCGYPAKYYNNAFVKSDGDTPEILTEDVTPSFRNGESMNKEELKVMLLSLLLGVIMCGAMILGGYL